MNPRMRMFREPGVDYIQAWRPVFDSR